ncbi:hypothetical protein [Ideonella sp.]|uniref:hypothetical protein n=1 Tax=Ideonella sp. TaxID=1929293 RepID=UPI0035B29460
MAISHARVLSCLLVGSGLAWSPSVFAQCNADGSRCLAAVSSSVAPGPGANGPLANRTATVMPNTATRLLGWVEYNRVDCTGVSGSWAVNTPPTRGTTSTEIVMRTLSNGDCPGVQFPFNFMVYTWTDADEKNLTDAFDATWTSPSFTQPEHFDITRAHVEVQSVDLVNTGDVVLNLFGPTGSTGTVTATFSGTPVSAAPQTTSTSFGPGSATVRIDRPALRKSVYNKLTVTWNLSPKALTTKHKPATNWNVLGVVRYSQYNTPYESACGATTSNVFVVDSLTGCNFTATTLRSRFARQVNLNGTGVSLTNGTLKAGAATTLATSCDGHFPPGATEDNSYLQVADVRGACNVPLTADSSLATARHYGVPCNGPIELVASDNTHFGGRVRHDTCPACSGDFNGTEGHIDHYASAQACTSNSVGDLGNYWSIRN